MTKRRPDEGTAEPTSLVPRRRGSAFAAAPAGEVDEVRLTLTSMQMVTRVGGPLALAVVGLIVLQASGGIPLPGAPIVLALMVANMLRVVPRSCSIDAAGVVRCTTWLHFTTEIEISSATVVLAPTGGYRRWFQGWIVKDHRKRMYLPPFAHGHAAFLAAMTRHGATVTT